MMLFEDPSTSMSLYRSDKDCTHRRAAERAERPTNSAERKKRTFVVRCRLYLQEEARNKSLDLRKFEIFFAFEKKQKRIYEFPFLISL